MKTEYQNYIIYRIRQLREERGYTQGKVASVIGISNGQMGNIESPKTSHKYTLSHILRICREFRFPIEQIFLEDEDFKKNTDLINLLIEKIVKYEQQ
ncbi:MULTISPECIES: helix-turn-helix transcriptional regulator [Prevotellaceae]|uniref:helix-turn-helix transcriptional regulator n=1 Tax=Prevotellaceae TaxID=171552 RepID=UPI0003D37D18|nr:MULTISPECIES: helix-turn-helix domain-containing protein [Prevotellaceae]ETD21610.1 hypothetical protein HMPREF1199_00685 [Hoylesella oralis CC98A]